MSKVYNVGIQRYRDYKIRVCGKDSIPLHSIYIMMFMNFAVFEARCRNASCTARKDRKKQSDTPNVIFI